MQSNQPDFLFIRYREHTILKNCHSHLFEEAKWHVSASFHQLHIALQVDKTDFCKSDSRISGGTVLANNRYEKRNH
jgi:hypothetical protein